MSPRAARTPVHSAPNNGAGGARIGLWCPLPVESISSSPLNPRKRFAREDLDELAASLAADGMLQPIVVKKVLHTGGGIVGGDRYEIVAGERRWRAARQLGWTEIPAIIRGDVDDATHLRLALLENLARTDLDPLEEAEGYRQLQELGMTQQTIAEAVHRSQPAIANAIRLLDAPDQVREHLAKREISPSHVLALLRYKAFPDVVVTMARLAAEKRTPTKELEKGLGGLWEFTAPLKEQKLIVELYKAEFDRAKVCGKCPFGAYVSTGYGGYCLKPEHFDELQKAARAMKKAEVQKALEKASNGDKKALRLNQLKYGQYEEIRFRVEGCSEACACRATALDGPRTVQICTKPAQYRRLQAEARKHEQELCERRAAELAERCGQVLAAVETVGSRELAIVASAALTDLRDDKRASQILSKHAPGFKLNGRKGCDDLASLEPLQLLKISVAALLSDELAALTRWGGAAIELASWYADKGKPKRSSKSAPIVPKPEDAAVSAVGQVLEDQHELVGAGAG